ncbi:retrovirus-related pol polyprotein from transposon TNT 1-94 [Tanacetum coccineum]
MATTDKHSRPHAAAAFRSNLMQTSPSTGQGTSNDTDIPFRSVPTDVSSVIPREIYMITILDDLRSQLEGHIKTNEEQSFANDSLKAELERYKTQVESNSLLQTELKRESRYKNALRKVMALVIGLRNTNKDLHKSALGHRNPLYLKSAQLCRPTLYLGDVIVDPVHTPLVKKGNSTLALRIKNASHRDVKRVKVKAYQIVSVLRPESNSNVSSRAVVPEKRKVLALGLYAMTPNEASLKALGKISCKRWFLAVEATGRKIYFRDTCPSSRFTKPEVVREKRARRASEEP